MNPFEDLIQELSYKMETTLHPDSHQSCLINFLEDDLSIQIDLDHNADRILIGIQLGRVTPGPYRERLFNHALRTNGISQFPRGILSFSEKNDTLVLFQFLNLSYLNGEKLYLFLNTFREHAKTWKNALTNGDLPPIEEVPETRSDGMFGLRP